MLLNYFLFFCLVRFYFKTSSDFQKLNIEIPLNLKFCFEGMEESGSEGLDERLKERQDTFLKVSSALFLM